VANGKINLSQWAIQVLGFVKTFFISFYPLTDFYINVNEKKKKEAVDDKARILRTLYVKLLCTAATIFLQISNSMVKRHS